MPVDGDDSLENDRTQEMDLSGLPTVNGEATEPTLVAGENSASSGETPPLSEGDKLGKYEVRCLLGRGAMGSVYLAFDPMIERQVAVKVLSIDVAAQSSALERFLTEARSTGRLNHQNVVSIFDIDEQDGQFYIVMEVLSGGSLAARTAEGTRVPWKEACRMVAEAADGLAAAHQAGLVHRDVKPENLMTTQDGTVKVVDFGLSKLIDAASDTRDAATRVGTILGTPQYMSPEQCETAAVDSRSDIYSLGGTLFRLLTGRHPYEDNASVLQVMMAHASKPIPDPLAHNPELPTACRDIVARAMAKKAEDRYQDAAEMAAELRDLIRADEVSGGRSLSGSPQQEYRALKSVVIVEPSRMQAMMLKNGLTNAGVGQVNVCGGAAEAHAALETSSPDVLITAMELRDGRGLDLLSEQRQRADGIGTMLILNSSDATADELVASGLDSPLALVSKKTRPDEIMRAIHACTFLDVADSPLAGAIDPAGSRVLVIGDSERLPETLVEQVRRLELLDLQVITFDQLVAEGPPSGIFDLVLTIRTAGDAENDSSLYLSRLDRVQAEARAVAALQVAGDRVTLRAIRLGGFTAITYCVLDDTRFTRILQIVQL